MRERDKLHARKDSRYKTIKHQVQKKFPAAYWQYVEEIITPTNDEDSMGGNKQLWGFFKPFKSDSKNNLITNAAGKATV